MTTLPIDKLTTLELVLFSGDRVRFRRMELSRALFHRNTLIFYFAFTVILAQLRMFNEMLTMTPVERLAFIAMGLAAVVVPAWLWIFLLERLQRPDSIRTLNVTNHLIVFSGISALLCSYLAYTLPGKPFPRPVHFLSIWLWFLVLAQVFTHYFLLVLVRRMLQDMRKTSQEVALDPTEATLLDIKGARVRLADLWRVAAEGNYIRVITSGSQHFLPGPFGPVTDALPDALGIRVSRSDWVARVAISKTHREGRDLSLELTDGSIVRVAQTKRRAVLDWINGAEQGGSSRDAGIKRTTRAV